MLLLVVAGVLAVRPLFDRPPAEPLLIPPFGETIDLNVAAAGELELLPEIGPALARRIVELRRARGRFRTIDELRDVRGIGPVTIERISPYVQLASPAGDPPAPPPTPPAAPRPEPSP
jgi:competence protein ComEA